MASVAGKRWRSGYGAACHGVGFCPAEWISKHATRLRAFLLDLADASFPGVFPSLRDPSSADDRGGRAGDMRTGGDMPAGSPSKDSSWSSLTARPAFVPFRPRGVALDKSITPFHFSGLTLVGE